MTLESDQERSQTSIAELQRELMKQSRIWLDGAAFVDQGLNRLIDQLVGGEPRVDDLRAPYLWFAHWPRIAVFMTGGSSP
jgi:hypothetical protein